MRRIAFINEKGGSCKTTLAVNMAAAFAEKGARVLLCDMDPQGQAGKSLGLLVRDLHPTVFEALTDRAIGLRDAIRPSHIRGLDVLCANKRLADFPIAVAAQSDRELLLSNKVQDLEGYDAILLDAPPSLGLLTTNVMLASQEIVVPVNLTYFAMDGQLACRGARSEALNRRYPAGLR